MVSQRFQRAFELLCIVAIVSFGRFTAAAAPIQWFSDYQAGLAKAQSEHRPVLIAFSAAWCVWCKRLDEEVYADAAVATALKDVVCLKIDTQDQPDVALAYSAQTTPRTIVLNTFGEIVGDLEGYTPLGPFLEFLAGLKDNLRRKTGGKRMPSVSARIDNAASEEMPINPETSAEEIIARLGDRDPAVRKEVARGIADSPRRFEILVSALASGYLGSRIAALETLKAFGAPEIPFDPWASKPDRDSALAKWSAWAHSNTLAAPTPQAP